MATIVSCLSDLCHTCSTAAVPSAAHLPSTLAAFSQNCHVQVPPRFTQQPHHTSHNCEHPVPGFFFLFIKKKSSLNLRCGTVNSRDAPGFASMSRFGSGSVVCCANSIRSLLPLSCRWFSFFRIIGRHCGWNPCRLIIFLPASFGCTIPAKALIAAGRQRYPTQCIHRLVEQVNSPPKPST